MKKVDVAIIGGGLSGVYLAYLLEQQGISYQLLEAKSRLGGRILGEPVAENNPLNVDLGPTWFWPHQPMIQQLIKTLNITAFQQYTAGEALRQLDAHSAPQRISAGGTMTSYRVSGGMIALIHTLSASLAMDNVLLSHPVNSLEKTAQGWQVKAARTVSYEGATAESIVLTATQLVVCVPPRVLLQSIVISPSMPEVLQYALAAIPTWMAAQAKFVACYRQPFWREAGLSGDVFSRVGPMVEIHDASASEGAAYALFGFIGLPAQRRAQMSSEATKQYCLQQLVTIFGEQALTPDQSYLKDWAMDTQVATPKDLLEAPAHPQLDLGAYHSWLTEMSLHFAGTEYAEMEAGYLEGALLSAQATAIALAR